MRFKEVKKLINEQEDLFEIKMTGKNLSKLASEIQGVQVGLEFEMIVPNTEVGDEDMEPDYDQDERVEDIDDCVNFFDDGDYNDSGTIRRLRNDMEDEYNSWKFGELDNAWENDGFEYFQEYLDREEPFDRDEALEEAEDYVRENHPDIEPGTDEYQTAVTERLDEMEANYAVDQWQDQGRTYDYAREEFDDEHRDDYSERDWLRDQGIYYAQDVQNNFDIVSWPHWRSAGGDETDVKQVALDFMRDSGLPYQSVAVSSSYHGSYEKWNGSEWVRIGSSKPDDCFAIEPDGSLEGDNRGDTGLEFVSPPIPLDQVGNVMSKVQQWAGNYGAYTGLSNATSMHTNISIPGYSIDKLDYVKAALLLGDEHVLRQFERMGNTYAKPAIEKVKQLVRDKPEKTKELLDLMKSQLNAQASKLLHSGITDKFTSINTKDNRIEFRSPGGDYLSDIADDPKKMQDTINRMVVAMDAAMDPDKYKEEYQKKLYKVLTGDIGSRKGKTGELEWTVKSKANVWDKDTRRQRPAFSLKVEAKTAKDAWKALKSMLPPGAIESEYTITPNKISTPGDKDLLNVFSRYAAGEMPKAALKSFIKQAQLQRKVAKGEQQGKMWWNVKYNGQRIEVVANNESGAKITAAKEWSLPPTPATYGQMQAEVLRPYEDVKAPELGGRPSNPDGNWIIFDRQAPTTPVYRYMASDNNDALNVLRQWIAANPGTEWGFTEDPNQSLGQPGKQQSAQQGGGLYKIFDMTSGRLITSDTYDSDQAALARAAESAQQYSIDVVVKNNLGEKIGTVSRYGTIVPTATQQSQTQQYELYNRDTGEVIDTFSARDDDESLVRLRDYNRFGAGRSNPQAFGVRRAPVPGSTLDLQRQRAAQGQSAVNTPPEGGTGENFTGNWGFWMTNADRFVRAPNQLDNNVLRRYPSREAAEAALAQAREQNPNVRSDIEIREIEPTRRPVGDINLFPEIEPTQQGATETEYIIFNMNDRSQLTGFRATNQAEAEREAESILRDLNLDPDQYDVRERNARPIGATGGTINTANEPTTGSEVGQTYSPSGTGSFTGQWLILNPNNQVIYRFGGIGNSQSDANRHAMNWLTQNPREMVDGVTVVPEMG